MMDTRNFIHTILQIGEQQQQELKRKKDEERHLISRVYVVVIDGD